MKGYDNLRGTVQISTTRVIAQPAPVRQHLLLAGGGKSCNSRERSDEALVIGNDGRDLRLLQHDLGQPDKVSPGTLPRQTVTAMLTLPVDQSGRKTGHNVIIDS